VRFIQQAGHAGHVMCTLSRDVHTTHCRSVISVAHVYGGP